MQEQSKKRERRERKWVRSGRDFGFWLQTLTAIKRFQARSAATLTIFSPTFYLSKGTSKTRQKSNKRPGKKYVRNSFSHMRLWTPLNKLECTKKTKEERNTHFQNKGMVSWKPIIMASIVSSEIGTRLCMPGWFNWSHMNWRCVLDSPPWPRS